MSVEVGFDEFGNLTPNEVIALSWEDAEKLLVTSAYKRTLWEQLLKYDSDLFEILQKTWTQWLGGSFLTTKDRPNDIDVVNFIELEADLKEKGKILVEKFLSNNSKRLYNIDGYFVVVYPRDDERFVKDTLTDMDYWRKWFGYNDKNRKPKGIIELKTEF